MFETIRDRLRGFQGGSLPFEGSFNSIKDRIAQIFENRQIGADLLYMITYMTSLALANATRPEIFLPHLNARNTSLRNTLPKSICS